MRVLQVNKYLFRRDGVTTVVERTIRLLRERGHAVTVFGQADPRNVTSDLTGAYVEPIALDTGDQPARRRLSCLLRILFGRGTRTAFVRLLNETRPDVVHVHNIYHHLGPQLIGMAKQRGIPVVMTVHDYKLFCPNYLFRRTPRYGNRICTACTKHGPFSAVRYRCVRDSAAASLVCFVETLFHRRYYRRLDQFIAPSRFMAQQAAAAGIPPARLRIVRNPTFRRRTPDETPAPAPESSAPVEILFLGRLYPEKGAGTLLEAFAHLSAAGDTAACPARLVIAGEGPQRRELQAAARRSNLSVTFPGFLSGIKKDEALHRAALVVFPSVWYENAPMTILEAFEAATPVVASRIGGIPEMITHGHNGLLVAPGRAQELANALGRLLTAPRLRQRLGRAARETARRVFSPGAYAKELEAVYGKLCPRAPHPPTPRR